MQEHQPRSARTSSAPTTANLTPTTLGKGIETELREGAASIHSEVQESASDQRQNQFQRLQQEGGLGLSRAALHRHKYHHIAGAGCSRRAAHKAITRSSSTVEPESVEPQLEVFPKIQHQQQNYSFVAKGCSSASITTPGNGAITTTTQQQEEEKQQSSSPIAVESPYQQPDSRSSCTTREKQQKEGERTQHEGSTPRLVVAAPAECPVGPRRLEREIKQRSSSAITLSTAASWSQSNRYRAVPLGSESGVAGVAIQSGAAGAGESRTSGSAGSQGQGAVSLRSGGGCSGAQGQHREGAGVASAEQTMMHMQQQEQDQQRKWRQLVDMQLSLSRFPDLTFLAKGAMCKCFMARSNPLRPYPVVLKMAIENGPRQAEQDLNTELTMLQSLSHPNLAQLLGAGRTPKGKTFIVVEYLDGGTLRQRLDAAGGGLGFWPACKHALELASVLRYMHNDAVPGRCVMHRDLKPDNLGFCGSELKLFDLGLSKVVKKIAEGTTEYYRMTGEVGSLRYMAPEVARQCPYNEKADVHSFGIILWEMVTGWLPFSGLSPDQFMFQVVQHGLRPMLQFQWDPKFKRLISACWAESPRSRPSFVQIHDALEALLVQREHFIASRQRNKGASEECKSQPAAAAINTSSSGSTPAPPAKSSIFARFLGGRSSSRSTQRSFSFR